MKRSQAVRAVGARRKRWLAGAAVAMVALLVTACGPTLAGSAAVVGETRITDEELSNQVDEVLTALNLEPSDRANQLVLDRLIREEIFNQMAERESVTVSDGEISAFVSKTESDLGGREVLERQLLQAGVPVSEILPFARTFLLQQRIAEKLAPNRSAQEQSQVFSLAAIALSETLDIRVSPRFGSWEPAQLVVGPIPNDLSVPAPGGSNPLSQVRPQQ